MEDKHTAQLQSMKEEKDKLQVLVLKQNTIIEELEKQLITASANNSFLQKQQHDLMETVHNLLTRMSPHDAPRASFVVKEEQITFKDCAEAYKSGLTTSGIYTITVPNTTEQVKTFCDMKTDGGGWTIIQNRFDGSVDFHRTWKEYKKVNPTEDTDTTDRALWLCYWGTDASSKANLCSIPFERELLFGKALEESIKKAVEEELELTPAYSPLVKLLTLRLQSENKTRGNPLAEPDWIILTTDSSARG
ncbi:Hypothetical predicted protein [Pelobates cultripes]|uniref:Fibrinogen C-terminal domain-containing protein n=1 Tax=Pelobates cultripes TaxID=61616 RepID=A0AAD1REK8_PELCU|nr:Hypothetical predicted protein [Pelobates cultripes]